jgi:hypothetical protein
VKKENGNHPLELEVKRRTIYVYKVPDNNKRKRKGTQKRKTT